MEQQIQELALHYNATINEIGITFTCLILFGFIGFLLISFFKSIDLFKDNIFNKIALVYIIVCVLLFTNLVIKWLFCMGMSAELFNVITKIIIK